VLQEDSKDINSFVKTFTRILVLLHSLSLRSLISFPNIPFHSTRGNRTLTVVISYSPANVRTRSLVGMLGGVRSRSCSNSGKALPPGRSFHRVPSLNRLLKRGDYHTVIQILNDPTANVERWLDFEYSLMGENALHFVMKFSPPAGLVTALIQRLIQQQDSGMSSTLQQQPELTVDLRGRTPLHHACEAQCEPAVILALLETSAGAISARAKDIDGKLPLHLMCLGYHPSPSLSRIRMNSNRLQQGRIDALTAMVTSIKLLVGLSPRTACVKDDQGRTALDYIQCRPVATENETCLQLWAAMELELSLAMDLLSTTTMSVYQHAGIVIKFPTECCDCDDVSVLSSTSV
jgi:hypothetical protein